jgi:hypothetical protein
VNQTFLVTQSGCSITAGAPFTGWTGTINSSNVFGISSPAGSQQVTCSGPLAGNTINLTCNPTCAVTVQKQ